MPVSYELPPPFSLNNMFANRRGGRHKTAEYTAWRDHAQLMLNQQQAQPQGNGPFRLAYLIGDQRPGARKLSVSADLSNMIKALEDALVEAGVLPDDSMKYVVGFCAELVPGRTGCAVTISEA